MNIDYECEQALQNDKYRRGINDKIILLKAMYRAWKRGSDARVTMNGSMVHIDILAIATLIEHYEERLAEQN